jgi:hypothetical protein
VAEVLADIVVMAVVVDMVNFLTLITAVIHLPTPMVMVLLGLVEQVAVVVLVPMTAVTVAWQQVSVEVWDYLDKEVMVQAELEILLVANTVSLDLEVAAVNMAGVLHWHLLEMDMQMLKMAVEAQFALFGLEPRDNSQVPV